MDGEATDPFEVVFTAASRRALDGLPMPVALAALAPSSSDLTANPHRVGKALHAPLTGRHSARLGDYRILYRIGDHVITVLDVEHRRDAYRR